MADRRDANLFRLPCNGYDIDADTHDPVWGRYDRFRDRDPPLPCMDNGLDDGIREGEAEGIWDSSPTSLRSADSR